jgi:N6-L-threonylcarbamoyladenine synthase
LFEISKFDCASGGAILEKYASYGNPNSYEKIISMSRNYMFKNKDCNFSFSGLLAQIFKLIEDQLKKEECITKINLNGEEKFILKEEIISNICALVQNVITLQLEDRIKRAVEFLRSKNIHAKYFVLSGGVASNIYIRNKLENICLEYQVRTSMTPIKYCTDNGVMIAWNGCEKLQENSKDIIFPEEQNNIFFKNLKPSPKSELGESLAVELKLLKIKINNKMKIKDKIIKCS